MRAKDQIFAKQVLDIGNGMDDGIIKVPLECIISEQTDLIEEIYGNIYECQNYADLKKPNDSFPV